MNKAKLSLTFGSNALLNVIVSTYHVSACNCYIHNGIRPKSIIHLFLMILRTRDTSRTRVWTHVNHMTLRSVTSCGSGACVQTQNQRSGMNHNGAAALDEECFVFNAWDPPIVNADVGPSISPVTKTVQSVLTRETLKVIMSGFWTFRRGYLVHVWWKQ